MMYIPAGKAFHTNNLRKILYMKTQLYSIKSTGLYLYQPKTKIVFFKMIREPLREPFATHIQIKGHCGLSNLTRVPYVLLQNPLSVLKYKYTTAYIASVIHSSTKSYLRLWINKKAFFCGAQFFTIFIELLTSLQSEK